VDVGDAEDAGDDGEGLAVGELLGDDVFGDAIEENHQGGDGENEAAFVARLGVELGGWGTRIARCWWTTSGLRLRGDGRCGVWRKVDGLESIGAAEADGGVSGVVAYVFG